MGFYKKKKDEFIAGRRLERDGGVQPLRIDTDVFYIVGLYLTMRGVRGHRGAQGGPDGRCPSCRSCTVT